MQAQEKTDKLVKVVRGEQADIPFNVAFVGGGKACYNLLKILDKERLSRLKMDILGVADINPDAPAIVYARSLNIFTTDNFQDLYKLERLNFIIELTGLESVKEEIIRTKPQKISLIGHRGARLLWDLVQMEVERTELETKRHEYQEKERKYTQVILDSLPYRIMAVNRDRTISTINQTFLREQSLTYKDIVGKHCYEVRYGLDRPCGEYGRPCYLEEIKDRGEIISTIHEYKSDNGETHFDVLTFSPILDEDGNLVQLLEASRDVTERIKLEREAQKSNIFFQNVIQSTVDGIVMVDTKGNVMIFNEGMERLTGYSAKEIMEKGHLSSFYNIDVAKENMKKMRSDKHGPVGKLNPTSMSITNKHGEQIPVTLSASIIVINGKEIGSVGVFTDMREILQMRKELEQAHFQLVQSDKIASVGRMAAGVAHEINNPLSGVLMYAELLKESLIDSDPQLKSDVQEIIDQTLRCKKIVADLLEFSRQSMGKAFSFSLDQLITKCLNLLVNQALFQDIHVNTMIDPNMPQLHGDMGQLQQVFSNLFINAAHAMEGKGRLDIEARFDTSKSRYIVKVSDTGPGIPESYRDKIFDMFFTTKPVGKGTGLGLSISQNIISLHGGILRFECPPEGGTTFIVELPLESGEASVEEPIFIGLDE
jgi:two-component system NtrC family sensor kinase